MNRFLCLAVFFALGVASAVMPAQDEATALDGPKRILRDELLDGMVGTWKLGGKVMGQAAEHDVEVKWVLNHQFLRIFEKDVAPPKDGNASYEAMVFLGYDNTSERYVVHWIDVYGGRASETLGYGKRSGAEIQFVFEYPEGPFHTTFRWKPDSNAWQWLMETKDKAGRWVEFGNMTLTQPRKP